MAVIGEKGQELPDVSKYSNGDAVIYYRTYTFNSLHDLRSKYVRFLEGN